MDTLQLVLLLLGASVLVVTACRAVNLPPILGYLLVGVIVGPHALDLISDRERAGHLAEFGVVFLMFSIGLEFSLPRLNAMKRIVFGLGLAQVVLTTLAIAAMAVAAVGVPWLVGIGLGGALAMSSTAILSKLLADRRELDVKHGREVMGVLLFQDLAVVPLLVVIPELARPMGELAGAVAFASVKAAALLTVVLFFGQKPMRAWFTLVARRKSAELFMLNVLLITLGLAWLTELAGLSLALGAFVAGMLISETEYRYMVEEDIKPFRDVLLGLFFISIGMMLDLSAIVHEWPRVLGVLAGLLIGKLVVVWALSRAFGATPGTALRTGLWLCAGGEFGFVLLARGEGVGLLAGGPLQPVLAALVLSLILAPLIVQFSDRIVLRLVASEWLQRSMQLTQLAVRSMESDKHAILCGYGRTGQHLARFLEHEDIGYVALDLDPERVREAANAGEPVSYGDGTRRETLIAAGLARASVVIVTFSDRGDTMRILHRVREVAPAVPVVVRSREQEDAAELFEAGAAEVVPEALEASVMLATHALAFVGVPLQRIVRHLRELREQQYGLLRGFFHGATDVGDRLDEADQPRLHSVTLAEGDNAVGRRLGELGLTEIGTTVSSLRRHGMRGMEPDGSVVLKAGDVVVLLGSAAAVNAGEGKLLRG
ncbi:MAG: cation:proton antiporter [Gammaproteobacteria bacterium]|nr:cation:proton antiporter [Gammaproteobacteria bacterium]MBU1415852.1 cation:proton antiporter [Gammaproteobacteria bacterium]